MRLEDMTLEQKIGQMIVAGFQSNWYDKHIETLIERYFVGNVILFTRNITDVIQLQKLNRDIQENIIKHTGNPGFITLDQEGGMVARIQEGVTWFPGNMAIGATNDKAVTHRQGNIVAEELRVLGINMNLAPVMDVNNNPRNPVIGTRSYGDSPEQVAEYGVGYIKGLQEKGVMATAKHFPGHGDTEVDSHLDLPVIHHDIERLEKTELYPFVEAVNAGVDGIMTAHVLFPAIEKKRVPATLSYEVITRLLREKLKFRGLIMTDCMEMKAIADYYGTPAAAVMAVKAGADLICISHQLKMQIESVEAIKEAVFKGEISEDRVNESVQRILTMKEKYGLFQDPFGDTSQLEKKVGNKESLEFARDISQRSITLVKDENHLIPITASNIITISTEVKGLTGAEAQYIKKIFIAGDIQQQLGGEALDMSLNPDENEINQFVHQGREKDLVIIGVYNANVNQGQARLVQKMKEVNHNVIVISMKNPYDLLLFPQVSTYLCGYEYTPLSIKSMIEVLSGRTTALGKLPVKISDEF